MLPLDPSETEAALGAPLSVAGAGEPIARGRDAEVYALGDGRVLRRYRGPGPTGREMRVMAWARSHGYPVPQVYGTETDLILDRLHGPTMLADRPNAARGDGLADVAYTWVILTTSRLEGSLLHRLILATGRRLFAAAFLAGFDRRAVFRQPPVVVRARLADRYVLDEERVRLRQLLAAAGHRPPA